MNIERILRLADVLDGTEPHEPETPLGFNMRIYRGSALPVDDPDYERSGYRDMSGKGCGTIACVAGWADELFGDETIPNYTPIGLRARRLLGLSAAEALRLFIPEGERIYEQATPQIASKVLRHLAATGEVDWFKFLPER